MDLSLDGRRAYVCGSTQGIGHASAKLLAAMGADVTLIARNKERLQQVCEELNHVGGRHNYICVDFAHPEKLKEALDLHISKGFKASILVNNTGGPPAGPAERAGVDEFRAAFESHLICNHYLVQALVPFMKETGYGRIINIISTSVKAPLAGLGVSNTIRGAVANWAKTLSFELGPHGITVNNVLPGATLTARLKNIITAKAEKSGRTYQEVEKHMMMEVPAQRFATPSEVANAVAFLASPAANYINGINLPVDGGRTPNL